MPLLRAASSPRLVYLLRLPLGGDCNGQANLRVYVSVLRSGRVRPEGVCFFFTFAFFFCVCLCVFFGQRLFEESVQERERKRPDKPFEGTKWMAWTFAHAMPGFGTTVAKRFINLFIFLLCDDGACLIHVCIDETNL